MGTVLCDTKFNLGIEISVVIILLHSVEIIIN